MRRTRNRDWMSSPTDESLDTQPPQKPNVRISAPVPRSRKPAGNGAEEEVSIDEYMTQPASADARGDSARRAGPAVSALRAPCRPLALPAIPSAGRARTAARACPTWAGRWRWLRVPLLQKGRST